MTRRDGGLEGVRALAILGVVATHASLSYLDTPIGWAIRDDSRSIAVDLAVWLGRLFLMPTFFFLAGWMTAGTLAREGLAGVARRRARRLALPLALALVPISLATNALWDWGRALDGRDPVAAPVPALRGSELPVTLGHLWFLYYLLWITAAALALAAFVRLPDRLRAVAPVALAAITAGVLLAEGQLQVDTPLGFLPDPLIAAHFGAFFAAGWLASAAPAPVPAWRPPLHAALACGMLAVCLPALDRGRAGGAPTTLELGAAAVSSWLLVLAFVGACRRWLAAPGPAVRALARASYGIYILHFPLVVLLQIGGSRLALPGPLEYAAILALTLATCGLVTSLRRPAGLGPVEAGPAPEEEVRVQRRSDVGPR